MALASIGNLLRPAKQLLLFPFSVFRKVRHLFFVLTHQFRLSMSVLVSYMLWSRSRGVARSYLFAIFVFPQTLFERAYPGSSLPVDFPRLKHPCAKVGIGCRAVIDWRARREQVGIIREERRGEDRQYS